MKLDRTSLITASESLLSAAALGSSWEDGLNMLAQAAGCHSACIWASRAGRPSYIGNKNFYEGVSKINRPGDTPYTDGVVMISSPGEHFISLDAHPQGKRVKRISFYKDVMAKNNFVRWASCSFAPAAGSILKLNLWRGDRDSAFEEGQIQYLNLIANNLRAAVTFARLSRDMVVRERSSGYALRGDPTFLLDSTGQATPVNGDANTEIVERFLQIRRGRLTAIFDEEARRLDKIVGEAVGPDGKTGSTVLTAVNGVRYQFLTIPLRGQALDVFSSTKAIATLVRIGEPASAFLSEDVAVILKTAFALTEREAGVAMLIARGLAPGAIARYLGIGEGTVRNHLKAVLRKVGVRGQVELAALLARYH